MGFRKQDSGLRNQDSGIRIRVPRARTQDSLEFYDFVLNPVF
jgi:hypothetical protein